MSPFSALIEQLDLPPLRRARTTTLQLNIGKKCNLACRHCHVESGPSRTEAMDRRGTDRVLELLEANSQVATLDITGGAPELNPHFRHVVRGARALGRRVIDRCNLTVLRIPGQEDTAEFLAALAIGSMATNASPARLTTLCIGSLSGEGPPPSNKLRVRCGLDQKRRATAETSAQIASRV